MPNFLIRKPINNISTISDEMGYRSKHPVTGKSNTPHNGIDLIPDNDRNVYAAHDGTVVFAGTQVDENNNPKGYGNYIKVRADDGRITLYAHLSKILVSVNQKIGTDNGEVTQIGIAGNSGTSSGVHLHFEIFEANGKRANPRIYLAESFPSEFPTDVEAGNLQGDITGDYRDNIMSANEKSNVQNNLKGLGGADTYSFLSISGSDQIIDSDFDGKIQINKVTLSGEAQPKTDKDGNEIEGQYSLNGYDLVRNGNDLIITKAGAITNLSKLSGDGLTNAIASAKNKITIKDQIDKIKFIIKDWSLILVSLILFILSFIEVSFANSFQKSQDFVKSSKEELNSIKEQDDTKLSIEELRKKYSSVDSVVKNPKYRNKYRSYIVSYIGGDIDIAPSDEDVAKVFILSDNAHLPEKMISYYSKNNDHLNQKQVEIKNFIFSKKILMNIALECETIKNYIPTNLSFYEELAVEKLFELNPLDFNQNVSRCIPQNKQQGVINLYKKLYPINSNAFPEFSDPDLKLSIEELRKKYPINWLEKKYGKSDETTCDEASCDYCEGDECNNSCPINLICTFYSSDNIKKDKLKEDLHAKQVSFDNFTESEIKSVFVAKTREPNLWYDFRIEEIKEITLKSLSKKIQQKSLTTDDKRLMNFIYSSKIFNAAFKKDNTN